MSNQKRIVRLYNDSLQDYDVHMQSTGHYRAQETVLGLLDAEIEEPVLDMACGTGFLMDLLTKKFSKVYGNDLSISAVNFIREKYSFSITNDNAEDLDSYNQKFNTLICCNLLFYIANRQKAVKRWSELLKEDGKLILIEEYPFVKPNSREMEKYKEELMQLIDPLSPEEIINFMKNNGFELEKKVKVEIDKKHNLNGLVFKII